MTELSKNLGKRIKEIRKSLGIQQIKLAEIIDMEPSNLCKLETGNQLPKAENIEKIADALNVEIKDLFDFGHIQTKDELYNKLINLLKSSSSKELELYYKMIKLCKEHRNI